MSELVVPSRFCGPPLSGNGGWTAGALAALDGLDCPERHDEVWPPIEVSLRAPAPLDTAMEVVESEGTFTALHNGAPVAVARRAPDPLTPVAPVSAAVASAASAGYPGHTASPFPTCFACGPERSEGDGLRIFPGALPDEPRRYAATWTPHPSVAEDWHTYADDHPRASVPVVWGALDCIGGWAADLTERVMVLGRMSAQVEALPRIGVEHVIVGELRESQGRKSWTAATMYDDEGRLMATAEHLWVEVDPAVFGGMTR